MATYIKDKDSFNKFLIRNGMTQTDLANKVGIGRPYMSSIANEHTPVGSKTAKKICDALKVTFDDIFIVSMSTKVLQK